jgi:aminoglycoside/choline kinase family phosphotransferase
MQEIENKLKELYTTWCRETPVSIIKLPGSGSYRSYYRIFGSHDTVIGVHNDDIRENEAFISFTERFLQSGLPVPGLLANDPPNRIYLLSDLGDMTLYQFLNEKRAKELQDHENLSAGQDGAPVPPEVLEVYKKAIAWLPVLQTRAGKLLDYSVCYPRAAFDRQSMMWDLNYFKYYFLKLARITFDEQAMEDDFNGLCDLLLEADAGYFLFRDFQSRNIMVFNGEPWFIDYQGGRKGALQYDIASLLYDGKASIPNNIRQELLDFYLDKLQEIEQVDRTKFMKAYYGFVLIRILQALGAYGFRGYYENKPHFLQSIPFALKNLHYLREHSRIGFGLETLMEVIDMMIGDERFYDKQQIEVISVNDSKNNALNKSNDHQENPGSLTVTICSFSYKKTIPADKNGNGGGFVFDCRALPNPGRYEEFKHLNGKDQPVIAYLEKCPEAGQFLDHVFALVCESVKTYTDRGFAHLMVSFGCTGGQHRSVYCAESLAKHLKNNSNTTVNLIHAEQDQKY